MDLTWYGLSCFRIRGRSAAVVTDPFPPTAGPRLKLEADLVTVSHPHPNHGFAAAVGRDPYVVHGPGEYEVAGVHVTGIPTFHDRQGGAEHGRNTVYVVEIDDIRVVHLGDLGHRLDDDAMGAIDEVDVLLVPVGGGRALEAAAAAEVVRQLDPRYVVPMHYAADLVTGAGLEPVGRFLKEMGAESAEATSKLTIQAAGAREGEQTRVVLLEARG